jgi:hypothetical protein
VPELFETATEYDAPLSASVVAGVVKLDEVAPEMAVLFLYH